MTNSSNKNSGYVGYSMSVRAAQARQNGSFPKTDFKAEYGLTAKAFDALREAGIVYVSERHHTSKRCNLTDFYSWVDDEYIAVYESRQGDIKALLKQLKKQPKWDEGISLFNAEGKEAYMRHLQECDAVEAENRKVIDEIKGIFYED